MVRRQTYAAPIWSADYFVLRHIGAFVRPRLESLAGRGCEVLDAGCGEQPLRRGLEALGARYTGLDVEQNRAGTVDIVAPLWNVPLSDASADLILVTEVLEHVADPERAFAELARLIRPNGSIVITTPFAYPLHETPHDYGRLTPAGLDALAQRHGLTVRESHAFGNEIEVLAVTFGNLLSNILTPLPFALRAAAAAVRLPLNVVVNATALIFSGMLSPVLPRKSFLTTAAILTK